MEAQIEAQKMTDLILYILLLTLICNNSLDINVHFDQTQPLYHSFLKKYPWYFQLLWKKLNINIDKIDRIVEMLKFQASIG